MAVSVSVYGHTLKKLLSKEINYSTLHAELLSSSATFTVTHTSKTSVDNGGTATVTMTIASPGVITDTGHGFSNGQAVTLDTTGALPTVTGSGSLGAGQSISLAGWQMALTGMPRSGDTVTVAKTAFPGGNNGNANAMVALGDAQIVGKGCSLGAGQSVTDAYASALAGIGVSVQSAKAAATQSAAIASDASTAAANQSGVNLDEEAARLIQYQQSYQAAAKMLQIAQTVFDSLLQIGN